MPGARLLLICGAVLATLLLVAALLRSRRRGGPMLTRTQTPPGVKGSLDATAGGRRANLALGREVADLLEAGRRVEAVRLVRGRTGWGLEEADAAVAKLEGLMKRLG